MVFKRVMYDQPLYRNYMYQRGGGLGGFGILRNIFNKAKPFLKKVGQKALEVSAKALADHNENNVGFTDALKSQAKIETKNAVNKLINKRSSPKNISRPKKRKRSTPTTLKKRSKQRKITL